MSGLRAVLERRIGVEEYLLYSTVVAVLLFVPLKGTFQAGYAVAIVNTLILLALNRLSIHRDHLIAIGMLAGFSMIAAVFSGTPLTAPVAQVLGISVMSVYFLAALTTFGPDEQRWIELYMRAAFAMAVLALLLWPFQRFVSGDPRLRAIYSEPSFYIYVTLPAFSYCVNCFMHQRRYGAEALVFFLTYLLADSSLGYIGIMLVALLVYWPRLKGWQILAGAFALCLAIGVLFVASANFRIRATEMAVAISTQDLSGTGASSFAILSNVYVAAHSFLAHPLTGVGIGGYANQYDIYYGDLTGTNPLLNPSMAYYESLQLNRDDASSMFLRVAAELGLPGLAVLIGFLVVCARVRGQPFLIIRNTLLPYLLVRMGRLGAYFSVEFYFFVGLYILNYLNYRRTKSSVDGAPVSEASQVRI